MANTGRVARNTNQDLRGVGTPSKRGPASKDSGRRTMLMGNKGKKRALDGLAQRDGASLIVNALEEYAESSQTSLATHEVNMISNLKSKLAAKAPIDKKEINALLVLLQSKDSVKYALVLKQMKELK